MQILITGGTGVIGRLLCKKLMEQGHAPVVLSRDAAARNRLGVRVRIIQWRAGRERVPAEALEGTEAVINLAGENIGAGRWTCSRKRLIYGKPCKCDPGPGGGLARVE